MTRIETFVRKPLVTASAGEDVARVARRMRDAGVGAVVLVEPGGVAGIFTERDLLGRVVAEGLDPAATDVARVCTREPVCVEADTPLRACAELLRDRGVRHLPVVRKGEPIGIVSARDFFEAVAGGFEQMLEHARYDEQLRGGIDPYDHFGGSYGR